MKSIKFSIANLFLAIFFLYGVCVGKYKWFPYEQLSVIKKKLRPVKNEQLSVIKKKLRPVEKLSNNKLLAELAKTNNIELSDNFNGLKSKSKSSLKSDSIKIISLGDNELKNIDGLLNYINKENSSLIVHVGDILDYWSKCTDSNTDYQLNLMNNLNVPVLYTPGDNEWRDCINTEKGDTHNLERLAYIRKTFFSKNKTLGRNPSIVENQRLRGYPENARLLKKNIAFISAHVIGTQNNFDPYSKENTLEYLQRDAANVDWITNSFERYKDASAYVVVIHADIFKSSKKIPLFFIQKYGSSDVETLEIEINPYENFTSSLLELSNKYKKPVLVLHGNQHVFRAFKPMESKFPFLHVIQNFGSPDIKAIEIEINPLKKVPFNVTQLIDLSS